MPVAYSYMRFSSTEQSDGDSIRRQTALREGWINRNPKYTLDTSLVDKGISGYHGTNRKSGALGRFLAEIEDGRVQRGDVLLIENMDRLSREKIVVATNLLTGILIAGVRVVALMPQEIELTEDSNLFQLLQGQMGQATGHEDSAKKSVRHKANWEALREEMRERAKNGRKIVEGHVVGHRLPGWVVQAKATIGPYRTKGGVRMVPLGGRLELDKDREKVVRRIFDMALAGNGVHAIALALNKDKVPVMGRTTFRGRAVKWNETVVYSVLKSRAAFGEFTPGTMQAKKRKAGDDPIADYYPPVIDKGTWLRAEQQLKSRCTHGSGRRGKHVNVFAGLLRDARDGGSLTYKNLKGRAPAIIPVGAKQGTGTTWSSFQADVFDRAIRSALVEIKANDIAGDNTARHTVEALRGEKAELEMLIGKWTPKMDDPDMVDIVTAKLKEYGGRLRDVNTKLADAERAAANPLDAAWKEFRTLAGTDPDQDTDDLRTRIKAAIRNSVESIWCLFTTVGRYRVAVVQVWFRGGSSRDYTIYYDAPRSNKKTKGTARVHVASMRDLCRERGWGSPDLRTLNDPDQPLDADALVASIQSTPAATIEALLNGSAKK